MNNNSEKRQHFRILYPPDIRPILTIGFNSYEIIDLSEKGIKFKINDIPFIYTNQVKAIVSNIDNQDTDISTEITGYLHIGENFSFKLVPDIPFDSNKFGPEVIISIQNKNRKAKLDDSIFYFSDKSGNLLAIMPEIDFEILFHDKEIYNLSGKILRIDETNSIILLSQSVPFSKIIREQQYIINNYAGYIKE